MFYNAIMKGYEGRKKRFLLFFAVMVVVCLLAGCDFVGSKDFFNRNTAVVGLKEIPYTGETAPATDIYGIYWLPQGDLSLSIPLDNPGNLELDSDSLEITSVPDNIESASLSGNTLNITLKNYVNTLVELRIFGVGGRIILEKTGADALAIKVFQPLVYTNVTSPIVNNLDTLNVNGINIDPEVLTGTGAHSTPYIYKTEAVLDSNDGVIILVSTADSQASTRLWIEGTGLIVPAANNSWEIEPHLLKSGDNEIWLQLTAENGIKRTYYKIEVQKLP